MFLTAKGYDEQIKSAEDSLGCLIILTNCPCCIRVFYRHPREVRYICHNHFDQGIIQWGNK